MRAVIQRVKNAQIKIEDQTTAQIDKGLLAFVAVRPEDTQKDIDYMISKILGLRIFEDDEGKMNLSVKDVDGEVLIVSQFTLYGDCRKGRRPSFIRAGSPTEAQKIYDQFLQEFRTKEPDVKAGVFQADMDVELTNDGPVTLLLDSERGF